MVIDWELFDGAAFLAALDNEAPWTQGDSPS